jgi:pimeloyl-ACP methyl ester carboxylesterase
LTTQPARAASKGQQLFAASVLRWLDTSHGRLAWRADGPQHGRPILLLQRFRGTMDDWDPDFLNALSGERCVIRFDSSGVGRSEGNVPDIVGMADVAAEVILRLGFDSADVLGWSLGGTVAQQLAVDYPNLVRRLIVAGSSPGPMTDGPQPHPRVAHVMTKSENDEDDYLFLFYPPTGTAISKGRISLRRIAGQSSRGPNVSATAFLGQVEAITNWPGVLHKAGELVVPMLVADGAHDIIFPAYRSFVLSQRAPNAKLVLYPESGHAFLFQRIEEFVREIQRFLAD